MNRFMSVKFKTLLASMTVVAGLAQNATASSGTQSIAVRTNAKAPCSEGNIGPIVVQSDALASVFISNGDDANPKFPMDVLIDSGATVTEDDTGTLSVNYDGASMPVGTLDPAKFKSDCAAGRSVDKGFVWEVPKIKINPEVSITASRVVHSCDSIGIFTVRYYRMVDLTATIQNGQQKMTLVPKSVSDPGGALRNALMFKSEEDCENWQSTWEQIP